ISHHGGKHRSRRGLPLNVLSGCQDRAGRPWTGALTVIEPGAGRRLDRAAAEASGMNIHIRHVRGKGAVADQAALERFQQQWATYQKLVDADAVASKEVGAILHGALAALPKPFAFVDIACGDAGQMKHALAGTKVSHYHGIDLSESALELAAKNLAGVPFEVEL